MTVLEQIKSWFITPEKARQLISANRESVKILEIINEHIKQATEKGHYAICFDVPLTKHDAYMVAAYDVLVDMGYGIKYWKVETGKCMRWTIEWFPAKVVTEQRPDFGFKPKHEVRSDPLRSTVVPQYIRAQLHALVLGDCMQFTLKTHAPTWDIINAIHKSGVYKVLYGRFDGDGFTFTVCLRG